MDTARFDALTRRLGAGMSRRAGLKAALCGILGLGIVAPPAREADAKTHKKKRSRMDCSAERPCPDGMYCAFAGDRPGQCICENSLLPPCGAACCGSGQACREHGGTLRCMCGSGNQGCGLACCAAGDICVDGACTAGPTCPSGQALRDGVCACTRPLCGGVCCAGNQSCQDGQCVTTGLRSCSFVQIVDGGDYSYCRLRNANIGLRTLRNANFEGADLTDATFSGRFQPWGCSFRGAKLIGADLDKCDIKPGTSFLQADLTGAKLTDGHLDGADFSGAVLRGVDFKTTRISATTFADAVLIDAILDGVVASGCDFGGANLHRSTIKNVTITDSAFVHADLSEAIFTKELTFKRNDFSRASFDFADMAYVNFTFTGCILDESSFYQVYTFGGTSQQKTEYEDKRFIDCRFHRTRFYGTGGGGSSTAYQASLWRLQFQGCDLTGARFDHSDMRGVRFTDCILDDADLSQTRFGKNGYPTVSPLTFTRTSMKRANLIGVRANAMEHPFMQAPYPEAKVIDVDLGGAVFSDNFPTTSVAWLRADLTGATGWLQPTGSDGYRCSTIQPDGSPLPDTGWCKFLPCCGLVNCPCSEAPRPGA